MKKQMNRYISAVLALIIGLCFVPTFFAFAENEQGDTAPTQVVDETEESEESTEPETSEDVTEPETSEAETTESEVSEEETTLSEEPSSAQEETSATNEEKPETTKKEKTSATKKEEETKKQKNPVKNYLTNHAILSYKYSPRDDYYYVSQANAWQKPYGFNKAYDVIAPYILLEYDYVRVYFRYGDNDYMVQLWKGQYGLVFFGGECGIYSKPHSDKEDTLFTTYKGLDGNHRPYMQITMYHDKKLNNNYERIFTTPYERTWWATGFKPGHLNREEPAKELRQQGKIVFENEEMAQLFASGLSECGFKVGEDLDSYTIDGKTVNYVWQNINEAESTMGVKVGTGFFAMTSLFFFAPLLFPVIVLALGTFGALCMLAVLVL